MAVAGSGTGVSVVIPVHNQSAQLEQLLESLDQQHPAPAEVLVVDDASTEDIASLCASRRVRHVRLSASGGPANARNVGAAEAAGDILLFLDADVVCPPTFVARTLEVLESEPQIAAVSFINQAYRHGDGLVKNFGAAIEHYWFQGNFTGDEELAPFRAFTTRNGAVRTAAFHAIQGFDTGFVTNAHEDYDFGKRLAARFPLVQVRAPLVYHNFPHALRRLLRNYYVRAKLFAGYYLQHRPPLDKTQSSPQEALLRIVGGSLPFWLLLALLPVPGTALWASVTLLAALAYFASILPFLRLAYRWSGSLRFTIGAAAIHFISSPVILTGAAMGVLAHFLQRDRHVLKSPIH